MPRYLEQDVMKVVAKAWSDVLMVEDLDAETNFFSAGGDSIFVTIVNLQLEEAFGVIFEPDTMYDHPTLGSFSEAIYRIVASQ